MNHVEKVKRSMRYRIVKWIWHSSQKVVSKSAKLLIHWINEADKKNP